MSHPINILLCTVITGFMMPIKAKSSTRVIGIDQRTFVGVFEHKRVKRRTGSIFNHFRNNPTSIAFFQPGDWNFTNRSPTRRCFLSQCLLDSFLPINVSSASTAPTNNGFSSPNSNDFRNLCAQNQTVF